MIQILTFILLGIGSSTLIASMGLSLVLNYRASGVINFAAGANAGYVAYVYWALTKKGALFIGYPIPIVPGGQAVAPFPALIISLLVAALIGYLQYVLLYRFLREASALAKVVASSGVLLVLEGAQIVAFGSDARSVTPLISGNSLNLGASLTIDYPSLLALVVTLVFAAGLSLLYKYTSFGILTRAAADNRKGALLIGIRPGRLEAINWTLASVITGLFGVLVSPIIGLQPDSITLYIVPALSAVLLARFVSFWGAAGTGIAIGALQSLVVWIQGFSWFPQSNNAPLPGVSQALPFVIIAVILFFRGQSFAGRQKEPSTSLPRAPRPNHLLVRFGVAIVLALIFLLAAPYGFRQALANSLIGIVLLLSYVVVTGYVGQVTLAQLAIAGVSGFLLSKASVMWGLDEGLSILIALAGAIVVNLLIAIPALRMRGMQLAVITLAGAFAIENLWFDNPVFGGGLSAATIKPPTLFGLKLGSNDSFWNDKTTPSPGFVLFLLAVTVIVAIGVVMLRRSPLGVRMLSVRSDAAAAAASGVSVAWTKFIAFGVAGLISGIAGLLYGYNYGLISQSQFTDVTAISFLAVAYLGGITTVSGAVMGGMLVTQGVMMYLITTVFGISSNFQILIAGFAVLTAVIGNPNGAAGFFRDRWQNFLHRRLQGQVELVGAEGSSSLADAEAASRVAVGEGSSSVATGGIAQDSANGQPSPDAQSPATAQSSSATESGAVKHA